MEKTKTYEGFKQEVLAKEQAGNCGVALSLPVDDEHQIKDKIFDQIPLDALKTDFGLNILIAFLDKHLAEDDLADSVENFDDLMILEGKMANQFMNILQCLMPNIGI